MSIRVHVVMNVEISLEFSENRGEFLGIRKVSNYAAIEHYFVCVRTVCYCDHVSPVSRK
jgi:hypothetical protein